MTVLVGRLRELVGDTNVLTGTDLEPHTVDVRGVFGGDALAAVRPGSTKEVAAVVGACGAAGVAVVTQGGNTGMSGGSVPFDDRPSVIVLLSRMRRVLDVDPVGNTITVEAGTTIQTVHDAAHEVGRMFAPDWGARGSATIGGAISTDAGGINVLRFGTMRHHVLGLEVVLADGRVWDGLRSLRKDSSGIDLTHLFIGAEGTLGVVTRATLHLLPAQPHTRSALASLTDLDGLDGLLASAQAVGDRLTALELIPELGLAAVVAKLGVAHPFTRPADWYVLVRFAGTEPVDDDVTRFLADASDRSVIDDAVVAHSVEREADLWLLRDELSPSLLFGPGLDSVKLDPAVPVAHVGRYIGRCKEIVARLAPGSQPLMFGHLGDGNIHTHVLPPADTGNWAAQKAALSKALDALTWELGGTISAEHGIGRALVDRVAGQKPSVELELAGAIRRLLDPDGLFNPGKTTS